MGYFVTYDLKLAIRPKNFKRALEIFNNLHSDEMLLQFARGGCYGSNTENKPVSEKRWYSWVENSKAPYANLRDAFENWGIVDDNVEFYIDEDTKDFVVRGSYDNKMGQQDFLIQQLAPVLRNTMIEAIGEDGWRFLWKVVNHKYECIEIPPISHVVPEDETSDDEDAFYGINNMKLSGLGI